MRIFFSILGFGVRIILAIAMILWTFIMNIVGFLIAVICER